MFGLISQLAHVEFFSPKPDETVAYLIDVLGMEHSEDHGDSVYLRGWGDYFHHSVVVKPGPAPALSHVGWRAAGEEQLKTAVARLEEKGAGEGWFEDTPGHGPAFRFRSPGGHLHEVFWEVERYQAPEHMRSTYPIRPQRYAPRGAAVRQLDHITYPTLNILTDVEWFRDVLGFRWMESAGPIRTAWTRSSSWRCPTPSRRTTWACCTTRRGSRAACTTSPCGSTSRSTSCGPPT